MREGSVCGRTFQSSDLVLVKGCSLSLPNFRDCYAVTVRSSRLYRVLSHCQGSDTRKEPSTLAKPTRARKFGVEIASSLLVCFFSFFFLASLLTSVHRQSLVGMECLFCHILAVVDALGYSCDVFGRKRVCTGDFGVLKKR